MTESTPTIVSEETLYEGKVFNVSRATVEHDELSYTRELVSHEGSAVVLPVHSDGRITLVRQYRLPARDFLFEVPAGTVDEGESPEECAFREIEEETGYAAAKIEKISEFFVSPGFLNEKMHLFFGFELTKTAQNLDDDEVLNVLTMAQKDAFELLDDGKIIDAKTIIALMFLRQRR